jgi:hypothetical protein
MAVETFRMIWPVIDTRRTRQELMAEATADLRAEYEKLGVRPVSAPNFTFKPDDIGRPSLMAQVAVVMLPRLPEGGAA